VSWSWKLGRLAGVDVYVHATFFILIAWIALGYWQAEGSLVAVVRGIGFILALFACVILHELGHSLTARHYGIRTRRITLLPIGGVAALERMPDDPREEMIVALAGPAVNLVIGLALWFWISVTGGFSLVESLGLTGGAFLERLLAINVMLAVFNMLPALPMDGGRVFRAALAMRMDHILATQKAARLGQGIALVLGFLGLLYNPFLIFIGLFVWIGAAAELHTEKLRSVVTGVTIGEVMQTDYKTLTSDDRLSHAVELTLNGSQKDFPVLNGEEVVGILTQADLLSGLTANGEAASVADWMQRGIQSVDSSLELHTYLETLSNPLLHRQLVTDHDRLVGIIDFENFSEFVRIQTALNPIAANGSRQ
jgi:Zn-dependent protease